MIQRLGASLCLSKMTSDCTIVKDCQQEFRFRVWSVFVVWCSFLSLIGCSSDSSNQSSDYIARKSISRLLLWPRANRQILWRQPDSFVVFHIFMWLSGNQFSMFIYGDYFWIIYRPHAELAIPFDRSGVEFKTSSVQVDVGNVVFACPNRWQRWLLFYYFIFGFWWKFLMKFR